MRQDLSYQISNLPLLVFQFFLVFFSHDMEDTRNSHVLLVEFQRKAAENQRTPHRMVMLKNKVAPKQAFLDTNLFQDHGEDVVAMRRISRASKI